MILRGSVFSQTLAMETGITILVPDGFSRDEPYRVAYLLHGLCGRNGDVVDYSMLPVFARDCHAVFVMPEVARSFYTDMTYGLRYFTYVADELPRICRDVFRISARREDTAVMGASMGGYGALKCALSRPEQYGSCCAFSSACLFLRDFLDGEGQQRDVQALKATYGDQLITDFQAAFGERLASDPRNDLLELARNVSNAAVKPRIYCTCGTEDGFHGDNVRFRDAIAQLNFDVVYEEWAGVHDWTFFNESYRRALQWCFGGPTPETRTYS
jgi:S-formylglutathione hydrolase FrmB